MKRRPSSGISPASSTSTMFRCENWRMMRASRTKRACTSSSREAGMIFTATTRPSATSCACQTLPIPPSPMGRTRRNRPPATTPWLVTPSRLLDASVRGKRRGR